MMMKGIEYTMCYVTTYILLKQFEEFKMKITDFDIDEYAKEVNKYEQILNSIHFSIIITYLIDYLCTSSYEAVHIDSEGEKYWVEIEKLRSK